MDKNKPELLAPVGSWEALVAAVENGADAVYLGGKAFSARAFASNFDNEEMERAFEYAHLRGVKAYVAVNTLLSDEELEEGVNYLKFLHEAGVDAVILQDLGVARLARKLLPNLEIHASTQMTVHNSDGVRQLQEMGFKRIVLAREVSLENIKSIKAETGADLETFVHGALCISYSGQCLLSSMIGGRSGNRGKCAQPCRMNYSLVNQKGQEVVDIEKMGKHLLSPRDIKTIEALPDLIAAGIDSLKIEGRMKKPEYVATVVKTYREALDRAYNSKEYKVTKTEDKRLRQIFNRDFSTGYFYGNLGMDLMNYKRPNNRGLRLGRVSNIDFKKHLVEVALEEDLSLGDGVEVWVTQGGRQGTFVHKIIHGGQSVDVASAGSKVYLDIPGKIRMGDRVFKTHDERLTREAKLSFAEGKGIRRTPIKFSVSAKVGEPLRITVESPQGLVGYGETEFIGVVAQKRPLAEETVLKQLERLGNTAFTLGEVQYDIEENVMVPISEINEARRKAITALEEAILSKYLVPKQSKDTFTKKYRALTNTIVKVKTSPTLAVAVGDLKSVEAAIKSGAKRVYFGIEGYRSKPKVTQEALYEAAEICKKRGIEFFLATPRILQENEYPRYVERLKDFDYNVLDGILVAQIGLVKYFKEVTDKLLVADFGLNIFNHQSLYTIQDWGFSTGVLSPEMTMEQIRNIGPISPIKLETIVHGALPLMISEYCVVGCTMGGKAPNEACSVPCGKDKFGLQDRMNFVFPVETDEFCRMHIYNPKELGLVEDIPSILSTGVEVIRIEARNQPVEYVKEVTAIYKERLSKLKLSADSDEVIRMKQTLEEISQAGLTKGHYFRGVL